MSDIPVYLGSYVKGVLASFGCQAIPLIAGIAMLDEHSSRPGLRGWGAILLALWGFAQWAFVLPLMWMWTRSGETRTVRGLMVASLVCAVPSAFMQVALWPGLFDWVARIWRRL